MLVGYHRDDIKNHLSMSELCCIARTQGPVPNQCPDLPSPMATLSLIRRRRCNSVSESYGNDDHKINAVRCFSFLALKRTPTRIFRDFQHIKMHEGVNLIPRKRIALLCAHITPGSEAKAPGSVATVTGNTDTDTSISRFSAIYIGPGHDGETKCPKTPKK